MSSDQTYRAIADATRRQILDLLAQHGTLAAGQIAQRLPGLSRPAVSRHLRVLRQARLVAAQRKYLDRQAGRGPGASAGPDELADGREQLYSLSPQPLALVQQWVERYRGYWLDKLGELARQVEGSPFEVHRAARAASAPTARRGAAAAPPLEPAPLNLDPLEIIGPRAMALGPALPMRQPTPVILTGQRVQLVPVTARAIPFFQAAVAYPELWSISTIPMHTPQDAQRYVESALAEQAAGRALPFGIMALPGTAGLDRLTFAGSTRFGNIAVEHGRVEIGWSWLLPQFQRTGINREAKLLLLTHAFEDLGVRRVEFKGDARNAKSRTALAGIGATFEGILRRHMTLPDGTQRDSFYFSIIAEEWPNVKAQLQAKLAAG